MASEHPQHTDGNGPESHGVSEAESRRAILLGVGGLAAGALLASSRQASAGPLVPPAGPVTSTGATLTDIAGRIAPPGGVAEPRIPISPENPGRIFAPGSYVLTGSRNSTGITIDAPNVTLDLNGFSIPSGTPTGVPNPSPAGISINATNVTVRNGRIRADLGTNAPAIAINVTQGSSSGIVLENLDIATNLIAVNASQTQGVILRNVTWTCFTAPTNGGLRLGAKAQIINCSGEGGSFGIITGIRSIIQSCSCKASGGTNFNLGESSIAIACISDGNAIGFLLNAGASLEACSAQGHVSTGISATGNARISRCQVSGGATGISLINGGNRVEHCKIGGARNGIETNGIDTIVDCSLNAAALRQGVGIATFGDFNTIDGNTIYGFNSGIQCFNSQSLSVITRNRVFDCTNPIVNGFGALVAPVATSLATAPNPFANLAY